MARLPIHWIEARAHCHATEEEGRVLQALNTACPGESLSREVVRGHFGNPLVVFRRRLAVLFRPLQAGLVPSPAVLRLALLGEASGALQVRIVKSRGGRPATVSLGH